MGVNGIECVVRFVGMLGRLFGVFGVPSLWVDGRSGMYLYGN